MARLKTDSSLSRRIVSAFLDFLDSVEAGAGVDVEGLEVARECLTEAFKLGSSVDDPVEPGFLINLFRTQEANENNQKTKSDSDCSTNSTDGFGSGGFDSDGPTISMDASHANHFHPSNTQDEDGMRERYTMGISKDELFGQFFDALERIHFFNATPEGNEDPVQLEKATRIFHDALNEMEKTGCLSYNRSSLSEALKLQGNRAMQSKLYCDAIQLYSCAISLCENNAVYYCNRAAAYTQIHKYTEAIRDCLKSIEIDPNYSKAYSRLGLAYYAQGNYRDAIEKGFTKALQLDPTNQSIMENIQVAVQKLTGAQQLTGQDQNTSSSSYYNQEFNNQPTGESRTYGMPPPFTSMSFNVNGVPFDFTNMFSNMASQPCMREQSQDRQGGDGNVNGSDGPEIRTGGNNGLNFPETQNIQEELRGAFRSMMEMFSGAAPQAHGNPQDNMDGRPPAN